MPSVWVIYRGNGALSGKVVLREFVMPTDPLGEIAIAGAAVVVDAIEQAREMLPAASEEITPDRGGLGLVAEVWI